MKDSLTWVEVSKSALNHNVRQVKSFISKDTTLAATVKANAYGHGLERSAKLFIAAGADWLSVISADEARQLREVGVTSPIFLLGIAPDSQLPWLIKNNIRLFVPSREYVIKIQKAAQSVNKEARIHANIDTGMGRYGVWYTKAGAFLESLRDISGVKLEGVATHFATADMQPNEQFQEQKQRFVPLMKQAPIAHAANSAALLADKDVHFDMVRPGIALYGYYPSKTIEQNTDIDLYPALSWKTRIVQTKQLPAGASISYGGIKTLQEEREIAILPVGYYDGVDRKLSNSGVVLINGRLAPILGRVCMDLTIVDVTDVAGVNTGDVVTIIGAEEEGEVLATDIAQEIDTIPYEVLVRIRDSIQRIYVD